MNRTALSDSEARHLLNKVRGGKPDLRGRHMLNFKVETSRGWAILRIPRPGFIGYDPRMLAEGDAIRMAAKAGANVPEVLYQADEFLIESFIEGYTVENTDWQRWLNGLLSQASIVRSANVNQSSEIGNVYDWQNWMRKFLLELFAYISSKYPGRINAVGLPNLDNVWAPNPRKSGAVTLVHADLHAENLLLDHNNRIWILDWELAVIADPVWEAAVSVHRMKWPDESARSAAGDLWLKSLEEVSDWADLKAKFETYRMLEIWKSILVDSVKYPNDVRENPEVLDNRVESFHRKLVAGHEVFGAANMSRDAVRALLSGWTTNE